MRELLRDFGHERLDHDFAIAIRCEIERNARFIVDHHAKGLLFLNQWCAGYTLAEIAMIHQVHVDVVKSSLRFSFELLGRRLQVQDQSVIQKVPPQLQPVALSIFKAYYSTFVEILTPVEGED
jgi:hypothetical protein